MNPQPPEHAVYAPQTVEEALQSVGSGQAQQILDAGVPVSSDVRAALEYLGARQPGDPSANPQ